MMATRTRKTKEFSEVELMKMAEPLTIVCYKIVGGKRSPIDLPHGPGESISGRGYTKDMVREFPKFLAEWSGGGMYEVEVTDSSGANSMQFEIYFHPNQVPEKTPPTMQAAPAAPAAAPAPAVAAAPPPVHPNYLSHMASTYHPQMQPQYAAGVAPMPNPYGWNGWQSHGVQSTPRVGFADPSAAKEREERLKLEAKLERQQQEAAHQKQMDGITQEMRRVQDQIGKHPAVEESTALKSAHDKIAALEQQNSTQVIMGQMQAMQAQTAQLIQQMQANTDKQIEAIRRESAETNRQDPMIAMMVQQTQAQAQASQSQMQMLTQVMQQNQTSQLEAARLNQQNQMGPREMIDLFRSANSGADQMANAYGRAWELMATGVESILQAQGPGVHPALAMLGSAAEGGLGMAQRYMEMKETEATSNAQARQVQAQLEAQTRIRQEQIRAQAAMERPLPAELSATATNEPAEKESEESENEAVEAEPAEVDIKEVEKELFGPAHDAIMRLRKGVAANTIAPIQTAAAILQAIDHFVAKGEIPAVFDLYREQRFADFVDALIPDASHSYREEATVALLAGINQLKQAAAQGTQPQGATA